jgi:uncharacterized damage-inducible protein DinB
MTVQDALAKHFGVMYGTAAANLDGFTQERSLVQPSPGGNCANWILGHLVNVQNGVMKLVGEQPVWESDQLARAGWDPITEPSGAIDWDTLRDRFLGSRDRCVAAIAKLSDASLAEMVPDPFGGKTSRGEMLNVLAYHQAYHIGQLGVVRRIAGLEGKVKGPGQPKAQPSGVGASR